jgi:ATP-binding cassette subfamily B protein
LTQQSLRTQIGIVLQKPHLFEGSLLDNLRFANKDLTEAEAYNTLVDIGAEKLALQLNDSVGESGENLSLGEKQIVSIARVILLKPALFILDEATSSIDPLSELIIQKGLEKLMMVSTSILIAHRLSTITNCDRILYIEKGKIIEDGSHKQLMHKKGKYFQLYIRQITEQRMEKINE